MSEQVTIDQRFRGPPKSGNDDELRAMAGASHGQADLTMAGP